MTVDCSFIDDKYGGSYAWDSACVDELPWQFLMVNEGSHNKQDWRHTSTARLPVPGGWLYRSEGYGMAFVPDPTAEHVRDAKKENSNGP